MWLMEMVKATDTGGAGLSIENRNGRILAEVFRKQALQSLAEGVRGSVMVEGSHVQYGGTTGCA